MAKKLEIPEIAILNPEAMKTIKDLQKKQDNGEKIDQRTVEALKAIDIASNTIDSIMSGRQIDMAFFQHASADIIKRLQAKPNEKNQRKRVKKKRKLYFKDKE
jgi:2-oxoglutarate dehydrogenase complex dehydrogenase (E1) component-like enzyme